MFGVKKEKTTKRRYQIVFDPAKIDSLTIERTLKKLSGVIAVQEIETLLNGGDLHA